MDFKGSTVKIFQIKYTFEKYSKILYPSFLKCILAFFFIFSTFSRQRGGPRKKLGWTRLYVPY